jgi:hypothetical protein
MRQLFLIVITIIISCTGKRASPGEVINEIQKCDSSFITLSFKDNINDSLINGGAMVILLNGVEEDIESLFTDPERLYFLNKEHQLCLNRASLYSKYYAGINDTLQGAVYCKGIGYSYPFDIIVADSIVSINLKLAFDQTGRQYPK